MSAAHCASKAKNHYYEVYAGLLRRFSYAPEVQISKVASIIVNDGFDRNGTIYFILEFKSVFNLNCSLFLL